MRVGARFLLAVIIAIPLGLWMGRVDFYLHNAQPCIPSTSPHFSDCMDSTRYSLVWSRQCIANLFNFYCLGFSADCDYRCRCPHN